MSARMVSSAAHSLAFSSSALLSAAWEPSMLKFMGVLTIAHSSLTFSHGIERCSRQTLLESHLGIIGVLKDTCECNGEGATR